MSKHLFRRSLGLVLALVLVLSALPISALASQSETADFTLIELVATDVTLDETIFEYTGSEIKPNVTVRVRDQLLTLDQDYTLEYADNVEVGTGKVIVTGIATASETLGYTGTVEIPFYINEKQPEFTLVEIKGTDVTINGTSFPYTGEPIQPAITVTIGDKTLTPEQDYTVEYVNNLVPGTGIVIIRGIATASETVGYTGEVRIDFTIEAIPEEKPEETPGETPDETPEEKPDDIPGEDPEETPEKPPLTEIKGTDVVMEGASFFFTGDPIQPRITVTIGGKTLTAGTDYSLTYENNVNVGTGKVVISGIATEEGGYTGTVTLNFTIQPRYTVTKGNGGTWNQGSSDTLRFTANGPLSHFDYLTVDGKTVPEKYYTLEEGSTVITLKNSFLKLLGQGSHSIKLHFTDGEAAAAFKVIPATDDSNPKTEDAFPLHLLCTVMFVSLTGILGAGYVWFRKVRR